MKTVKNVDDKFKNKLPSTKTAKNVDDKLNISPPIHENRRKRG